MKLEVAMLVGPESKQFLADLTKQLDRMEALKGSAAPAETAAPAKNEKKNEKNSSGKKDAAKTEPAPEAGVETDEFADASESSDGDDLDMDLDSGDAADEPTLDDVRKVVKDFATKHGKEKALKLLGKFKVTSIPDIKKGDYAKVIELAKKHL